jgi:hypothetical protein
MIETLVQIRDLPMGAVFRKPKGDVLFLLTSNFLFERLASHGGTWFPQPGGIFGAQPSIYPIPVDKTSLHFAYKAWSERGLGRFTIPAVSLHLGRFEFFPLDKVVVLEAAPEGFEVKSKAQQALDEYVVRDGPVERITRIWNGLNDMPYIVIKYPSRYWTKGAAWEHLVANPPPEVLRWPGVSKDSNPYRAKHRYGEEFCWMARIPTLRGIPVEVCSEESQPVRQRSMKLLGENLEAFT